MQIRGEAAVACGFIGGVAVGLLFDGCFDGYINGFRRPVRAASRVFRVRSGGSGENHTKSSSEMRVIVTKNGKRYHNAAGCKGLNGTAVIKTVPLKQAIARGKSPCPVCRPPVLE